MIITKIIGGLGNQLFQYAAGKSLAYIHQTELLLDVTSFEAYKLRNLDLNAFPVTFRIASHSQIKLFTQRNFLEKIRDNIFPMPMRRLYKPKHFHFHKRFFSLSSDSYLQGYWQSEKYFLPIAESIRQELTMKPAFIENVTELSNTLQTQNSIAVHIRRGDYNNPAINDMHGTLGALYYSKAIDYFKTRFPGCVFYVFSDDMVWAQNNLPQENTVYVSGVLSHTHFEDFYLMTQCKHNIIANSSFSWWGAWLNNNPGKIVIAPKKWFNKGPKDTQDLIPGNWVRLE